MRKIRIEVDDDLRFEGALSPIHDIYLPDPGKGDPGLFVDAAFGVVLEGGDIDRVKEGHDVVVAITGDVRYEMFLVAGEGSPGTGALLLFGETVFDVKRDTVRKVVETVDLSTVSATLATEIIGQSVDGPHHASVMRAVRDHVEMWRTGVAA